MGEIVLIIGDGAMPIVCSRILAAAGRPLRMYTPFEENAAVMRDTGGHERYLPGAKLPDGIDITAAAEGTFDDVGLILSAVPTQFIRTWWGPLVSACPAGVPICSVSKGIENDTLLRPSEVISDVLGGSAAGRSIGVLSGPNIAHELVRELPATSVVASADEAFAGELQQLFTRPYFRIYASADVVGVEVAAATKNIIAIAAGILDGMSAGDNAKAALVTRGLVEIARLGLALGGQRETFSGLAGLGDLVTTCISPYGRNRSFGEAVGRGENPQDVIERTDSVVEGVATTTSVLALADRHGVEMPIARAVNAIIFEGQSPAEAIAGLMSRRPRREDDSQT